MYLCNSGISVPSQYEVEGILPGHGGLYPQEGMGCLLNTYCTTKIIILKEQKKIKKHVCRYMKIQANVSCTQQSSNSWCVGHCTCTCVLSALVRTFIMIDAVDIMQWILHGEMAHLSCHLDVELCEVAIESSLLLDL